ncbi:hypothetical protein NEIMUCOT_05074 [Neisseria mucosa ATCC 25996]|uniref:Uncharacterized protein n=1 Tax=Neisseria mucosa (strain ATCC 25996 / DSM 4631 / NCTC 10774 / M26) TaxID=546266 RepID=D2ZWS6_NEIM2|nr:hypothetical protein NEIMUCOT_05074 [Neisseria mucosa ATCC 25996]
MGYAHENMKGRLKPVRRLSDDLHFSKNNPWAKPTLRLTVFKTPVAWRSHGFPPSRE